MRTHFLIIAMTMCGPAVAQPVSGGASGTITGALSYPSDFIPEDLTVCAEDISTKKLHCTSRKTRSGKRYSYTLTAPAGEYFVFARTKEMQGVRAYYSDFVTCGLDAKCKSHKPIKVVVNPGATTKSVNPQDWYAQ